MEEGVPGRETGLKAPCLRNTKERLVRLVELVSGRLSVGGGVPEGVGAAPWMSATHLVGELKTSVFILEEGMAGGRAGFEFHFTVNTG